MEHGGDIYRNRVELDFSVNLNPLGTPEPILFAAMDSMRRISVYPDPAQEAVRRSLAALEGVSVQEVIAGNGASDLLLAAVRALRPRRAILLEPAFTGYAHVLAAAGCRIRRVLLTASEGFRLQGEALSGLYALLRESGRGGHAGRDLLILCNPANPTGMAIGDEVLLPLLKEAQRQGVPVLLDESFFLLSDQAGPADRDRGRRLLRECRELLLVRSLTKLFAMPGIRAGYVLSAPEKICLLQAQLSEWCLSAAAEAAIIAGCRLLTETDFAEASRRLIRMEKDDLEAELRKSGLTVYRGEAPYLLLQGPEMLFQALLDRGILIRDCSSFPGLGRGWFRIAVKDRASNEALLKGLRDVV